MCQFKRKRQALFRDKTPEMGVPCHKIWVKFEFKGAWIHSACFGTGGGTSDFAKASTGQVGAPRPGEFRAP